MLELAPAFACLASVVKITEFEGPAIPAQEAWRDDQLLALPAQVWQDFLFVANVAAYAEGTEPHNGSEKRMIPLSL